MNLDNDLKIFTAMVEHLTPYIYEDNLFGQISNRLPKLTLGGLLMRRYRLQSLEDKLSSGQRQRFHSNNEAFARLRYEWLTHFHEKLLKEFESRVNAIQWYLDDCAKDRKSCDPNWPNEAEKRTIVHHVVEAAKEDNIMTEALNGKLTAIDARLRGLAVGKKFLWDDDLRSIYPVETFWWLYGRPGERSDIDD